MTIKIMFVDDEEDQLFTYEQMLRESTDKDYDIIYTKSGEECLKRLEAGVMPDIIFLDIMMPEMTGWEVFDKIRDNKVWGEIPIVFLTARKDQIASEAGKYLAEEYLEKPVELNVLIQCIEKLTVET